MKYVALLIFGVMTASTGALAQAPPDAVAKALLAAPDKLKDDATVVVWKADNTYETVKKGANRLVCYDLSGRPERQAFMIECTSIANLDRVSQNLKFEASGDKVKTQALLDAAEKDGSRLKPEYGSVWYHYMGTDRDHARAHMTIAVPGATTQSTGIPDTPAKGTVWIMNAGTTTAHLMTPGE